LGEAPSPETLGEALLLHGGGPSASSAAPAALPYVGSDVARAQRKLGSQSEGQIHWQSIASGAAAASAGGGLNRARQTSGGGGGGGGARWGSFSVVDRGFEAAPSQLPRVSHLSAIHLSVAALMQAMGAEVSGESASGRTTSAGGGGPSYDLSSAHSRHTSDSSAVPSDFAASVGGLSPAESDEEADAHHVEGVNSKTASASAAFNEVYAALANVGNDGRLSDGAAYINEAPNASSGSGNGYAVGVSKGTTSTEMSATTRRRARFAAAEQHSGDFGARQGAIVLDVEYTPPPPPNTQQHSQPPRFEEHEHAQHPWSLGGGRLRTITLRLHDPGAMTVGDLKLRVEGVLRRQARAAHTRAQTLAIALAADVAAAAANAAVRTAYIEDIGGAAAEAMTEAFSMGDCARRIAEVTGVATAAARCVTVSAASQRMFNRGHVMKDHLGLQFYNLTSRSVVLLGWFTSSSYEEYDGSGGGGGGGKERGVHREGREGGAGHNFVPMTEPITRVARRHEQQHKRLSERLLERESELRELRLRKQQRLIGVHPNANAAVSSTGISGTSSASDTDDAAAEPMHVAQRRARRDERRRERRRQRGGGHLRSISAEDIGDHAIDFLGDIAVLLGREKDPSSPSDAARRSTSPTMEDREDDVSRRATRVRASGSASASASATAIFSRHERSREWGGGGAPSSAATRGGGFKWPRGLELDRKEGGEVGSGAGDRGDGSGSGSGLGSLDASGDGNESPKRSGLLFHTLTKGFHTVRRITRNLSPKPLKLYREGGTASSSPPVALNAPLDERSLLDAPARMNPQRYGVMGQDSEEAIALAAEVNWGEMVSAGSPIHTGEAATRKHLQESSRTTDAEGVVAAAAAKTAETDEVQESSIGDFAEPEEVVQSHTVHAEARV